MTTSTAPAGLARTVRVTVELRPEEHADLRRLCEEYATGIGLTRVAGSEVLRALLGELRADEQLRERVGEALRASGGSRRHA
jgi:hypothetical protein